MCGVHTYMLTVILAGCSEHDASWAMVFGRGGEVGERVDGVVVCCECHDW